jgi:hypothetical protein
MIDGAAKNQLDRAVETEYLLASQAIGRDGWVNAAAEEGLVGVDVADAGHEALVKKGGFDGTTGFGEALGKLGGTDLEWLGAEVCVMWLTVAEPPDAAEAAGIDEAQL